MDLLILDSKVVFEKCGQYLRTPSDVAHVECIFRSVTLVFKSPVYQVLSLVSHRVMKVFGMRFIAASKGVIKCHENGSCYFSETASRVGVVHLVEMIEAFSGINLWTQ